MEGKELEQNGETVTPKDESLETKQDVKTFTQDDLDKIVESRIKREQEKFAKKLEEEKAEAERISQLSQKEREAELLRQSEQQLNEKERQIQLRENKLDAIQKLNELGMPIAFTDFVISIDKEKQERRIAKLQEAFNDQVSKTVEDKLRGNAPKNYESTTSTPKPIRSEF